MLLFRKSLFETIIHFTAIIFFAAIFGLIFYACIILFQIKFPMYDRFQFVLVTACVCPILLMVFNFIYYRINKTSILPILFDIRLDTFCFLIVIVCIIGQVNAIVEVNSRLEK